MITSSCMLIILWSIVHLLSDMSRPAVLEFKWSTVPCLKWGLLIVTIASWSEVICDDILPLLKCAGAVTYLTWHILPQLLHLPLQHYFHFVWVKGWQNFCQPSLLFLWYLHLVWLQVVCQCYLMLAKQRDLLKLHKPPQSKDKLKDQDLKVSMAAGSLFGDKASLMSARYMSSAVQSVNCALACHWCHDSVWE